MDGDIGIGSDGMGVDPDRGRGGAQDGIRPGVRAPLLPFWGHGPMDRDVCQYRRLRPLRLLLSEFLSTTKRFSAFSASSAFSARRRMGRVALAAFGLSLCIESLQLILRLGVFEITDLVLNTVGGGVGGLMSVGLRKVMRSEVTHFRP